MNKVVAKFEKVSIEQFKKDLIEIFPSFKWVSISTLNEIYNNIQLPRRATAQSAGYDFCSPIDMFIRAGESFTVPTGIRVRIDDGWCLQCYPRSGLGFKHRMSLMNTVGIIDADYYHANNEGHILLKVYNGDPKKKELFVGSDKAFAQGIFVPFGITEDDETNGVRNGGFGSTDE